MLATFSLSQIISVSNFVTFFFEHLTIWRFSTALVAAKVHTYKIVQIRISGGRHRHLSVCVCAFHCLVCVDECGGLCQKAADQVSAFFFISFVFYFH
jgi:hypothetical protein